MRLVHRGLLGSFLCLLMAACLLAASPASAETDAETAVSPVCASPDYDYWTQHAGDYAQGIEGSSESDVKLHLSYEVGVGASLGCAFQSRQQGHPVCTGPGGTPPCTTAYEYVPHVAATAFPDTIDAAGGDHQNVHINAPGTTPWYADTGPTVGWGSCFPGATYAPGACDPALFRFETNGFPYAGGQMLYRFRDETGHFRGNWTLSYGLVSPGFRLEHTASSVCDLHATACDYDVIFTRDPLNKPVIGRDAQVLLILPNAHTGVYGDPNYAASTIAVPMLVIQSGGGDASGKSQPPDLGTPSTKPIPPVAPGPSQIKLAGAVPKRLALAKRGSVVVKVPVAERGIKVDGVLTLKAAAAKGLGLRVKKGASKVVIGSGSATSLKAGPLTLNIKLSRAAKAALGQGTVGGALKAAMELTFSKAGVAAAPVSKVLTIAN